MRIQNAELAERQAKKQEEVLRATLSRLDELKATTRAASSISLSNLAKSEGAYEEWLDAQSLKDNADVAVVCSLGGASVVVHPTGHTPKWVSSKSEPQQTPAFAAWLRREGASPTATSVGWLSSGGGYVKLIEVSGKSAYDSLLSSRHAVRPIRGTCDLVYALGGPEAVAGLDAVAGLRSRMLLVVELKPTHKVLRKETLRQSRVELVLFRAVAADRIPIVLHTDCVR